MTLVLISNERIICRSAGCSTSIESSKQTFFYSSTGIVKELSFSFEKKNSLYSYMHVASSKEYFKTFVDSSRSKKSLASKQNGPVKFLKFEHSTHCLQQV